MTLHSHTYTHTQVHQCEYFSDEAHVRMIFISARERFVCLLAAAAAAAAPRMVKTGASKRSTIHIELHIININGTALHYGCCFFLTHKYSNLFIHFVLYMPAAAAAFRANVVHTQHTI